MFWTGVLNVGIVVLAAVALTVALRVAARGDAPGRRRLFRTSSLVPAMDDLLDQLECVLGRQSEPDQRDVRALARP